MDEIKKYDTVFKDASYSSLQASQGLRYVAKICADFKFKSVLDVGCGPGWSVMEFLGRGYAAKGVEPCDYLFQHELRVPAGIGIVKKAPITAIPYPADSFDMVFCTDVLEHVPEADIHQAISELIRVSKKYIFASICSQEAICFPELKLHCTVKPREWWEAEFNRFKLKKKVYGEGSNEYMYIKI